MHLYHHSFNKYFEFLSDQTLVAKLKSLAHKFKEQNLKIPTSKSIYAIENPNCLAGCI